jgi:PAS domain S-box-containing protein
LDAFKEVPLIVTLDQFEAGAAARALESGADEFLVQPFRAPEVLARVAVLLRLQDDRRLLVASQEEFNLIFHQTPHPLFLCDRQGGSYTLNPTLARLLGYSPKGDHKLPQATADLLYGPEDQERLRQILHREGEVKHIKVHLKSREGKAVPVLLNDVALPASGPEVQGFRVEPVGSPSTLKKALRGLVEHLLPSARDYLALLQLTSAGRPLGENQEVGARQFRGGVVGGGHRGNGSPAPICGQDPLPEGGECQIPQRGRHLPEACPHPGVVGLVCTLEDEGRLILIQEYAAGKTLADMLGRNCPGPWWSGSCCN